MHLQGLKAYRIDPIDGTTVDALGWKPKATEDGDQHMHHDLPRCDRARLRSPARRMTSGRHGSVRCRLPATPRTPRSIGSYRCPCAQGSLLPALLMDSGNRQCDLIWWLREPRRLLVIFGDYKLCKGLYLSDDQIGQQKDMMSLQAPCRYKTLFFGYSPKLGAVQITPCEYTCDPGQGLRSGSQMCLDLYFLCPGRSPNVTCRGHHACEPRRQL